ncbi:MAG: cytochrome P450 [Myxococcota bacterium]
MVALPSLLPVDGPPPSFPLLGQALSMNRDPLGFLLQVHRTGGDVASLRLGPSRGHLVGSPEGAEAVLRSRAKLYSRRTRVWSTMERFLGQGILITEGERWKKQRRVVNPAFHRRRLRAFGEVMVAETEAMLAGWRDGQVVDVADAMMRVTLRIVSKTLFGTTTDADADTIAAAIDVGQRFVEHTMAGFLVLPLSVPTRKNRTFKAAVADLDAVAGRLIERRRAELAAGGGGDDVLTMLLEARTEDGEPLPTQQIRDEIITLLSAGHETTANALAWTFYRLSRHPEVVRRLQEELERALGGTPPGMGDLEAVPYARWVFQEAMRLHPPAWVTGRMVKEPHDLLSVARKPGEITLVSPYVVHRRADLYANPEGFDPARWEELSKPGALPPFAYFPFGGGPRKCIGEAFAMMEGLLVLMRVAQRFELELVPGHPVEPMPQITLGLRHGLRMRLRQRGG